ncbi:Peroxidase 6 precursor family protein [Tripterygium wilfordii]|uniref:Peroxidase n=1 Tax=Tripterygium wilfordii TaxID=458696 RepID=A0A7J7D1G3_TRIWF|nr:peroxidase 6-like [Tripterygium wilfordii]KAF5740163.1 Peroxidase 6 precursor family protein [Tripterygium wilfordii]
MVESLYPLLLFFLLLNFLPFSHSKLTLDYYNKTCPQFHDIMQRISVEKQMASPSTAAATIRLFFHDCVVDGCDASTLVSSTAFNKAERDAEINLSLAGDGFDIITHAKTALELQCPGIVSCSDILATAARNLVVTTGGPYYKVRLGRKDGLVSNASRVEGNIAKEDMPLTKIISIFEAKGLTIKELVALVGAHTVGFSHCESFAKRIFNFSKTSEYDPAMNPKYAQGLRKLCENYTKDPEMSAFNDVMTPGKFDNLYYRNLQRGLALLASDQEMAVDKRTKPIVDLYAANQSAFFHDFAHAMEKVSVLNVKTGKKGEVRHKCSEFNHFDGGK